jgi:heat-inducible transcriptional repressor
VSPTREGERFEQLGFVASPHTSSGRVPTNRGYRFFVDTLLTLKELDRVEISQLEVNLHPGHPQRMITAASELLSNLTHFAGVVMASKRKTPAFRHIEFLALSDKRVLLIIVTPEGDVQNRILFTEKTYTPSELTTAANFLNQNYAGLTFEEIRGRIHAEMKQLREDMTALMTAALEAGSEALAQSTESYVVSGERNLLDSHDRPPNACWSCSAFRKRRFSCRYSRSAPAPRASRSSSEANPASRRSTNAAWSRRPTKSTDK